MVVSELCILQEYCVMNGTDFQQNIYVCNNVRETLMGENIIR